MVMLMLVHTQLLYHPQRWIMRACAVLSAVHRGISSLFFLAYPYPSTRTQTHSPICNRKAFGWEQDLGKCNAMFVKTAVQMYNIFLTRSFNGVKISQKTAFLTTLFQPLSNMQHSLHLQHLIHLAAHSISFCFSCHYCDNQAYFFLAFHFTHKHIYSNFRKISLLTFSLWWGIFFYYLYQRLKD